MIRALGAAAVGERLEELASAIRQELTAAMEQEAEVLVAEAKRRCPTDTGALRDSIRAEVRAQGAEVDAVVGSGLAFAPSVEFGTLARPPAPFLAPALQARKDAFGERIRHAVRRALRSTQSKGEPE